MLAYASKTLITGTGRCGTKYIAAVANRLGLRLAHERIAADGVVAWQCAPSARFFGRVLHQVRHPLAGIASLTTVGEISAHLAAAACPRLQQYDPRTTRFAMAMWLEWNETIEPYATFRYRIENFESEFLPWCEAARVPEDRRVWSALADISTKTNARGHASLSWRNLEKEDGELTERIRAKARLYGYENLND